MPSSFELLAEAEYTEVRTTMLPSLGFIGGTWADSLNIPISSDLNGVRVTNLNTTADYVNFRYLTPMRDGQPLKIDSELVSPLESSHRLDHAIPPYLLQTSGSGVHTGKEIGAWWEASLAEPIQTDSLQYLNRRDKWGIRSQQIRIDVQSPNGKWTEVYNSTSSAYVRQVVDRLIGIGGSTFPNWMPQHYEDSLRWHDDAVHSVRCALDRQPLQMKPEDWLSVAALIPTRAYKGAKVSPLSGNEWRLLAHGLYNQVRRDVRARSGIASFGGVLNTRSSLRRLGAEIREISEEAGAVPHTVSRHGVAPLGVLHSKGDEFVQGMLEVSRDLHSIGSRTMLAYGTLLGAVREGGFIQHDDDVDLFYTVEPSETETIVEATRRIMERLRERGWRVTPIPKYMNAHITKPGSAVSLDLFPLDLSGQTVPVHMEAMRIRDLPADWFTRRTQYLIDGTAFPAPAEAEAFLRDRYGESWRVPDPFHDWAWNLVE